MAGADGCAVGTGGSDGLVDWCGRVCRAYRERAARVVRWLNAYGKSREEEALIQGDAGDDV